MPADAGAPSLYLSGFQFVPGRLTGLLPQHAIDHFIDAVTPRPPSVLLGDELATR